jgi:hypothetical protein
MKIVNQSALDVGRLADLRAQAYYAHSAAMEVALDSRAAALLPEIKAGNPTPVGSVIRKDGTAHIYNAAHYLSLVKEIPDFENVWLVGSILTLGDALENAEYFDHAPELELLFHLRNGVAHGNKFNITISGEKRLRKTPAHNRFADVKSERKTVFEITPALNGQAVLFDYMGPGDVLDLLMSIGLYLGRMGVGRPLRR